MDSKVIIDCFCEHYAFALWSDTPLPVSRALRKLGGDIRDACRRRRIPTMTMAARASISRTTLVKVEQGDPGVQLGIYATVLFILQLVNKA